MHKRNKKKITIILLFVMCAMLLLTTSMAFAADDGDVGSLNTRAEKTKNDIVKAIQDIAKILAVIFVVWAGVIMWGSGGDPQKKAAAKDKLLFFLIAVFMIKEAEAIVSTIWGWL